MSDSNTLLPLLILCFTSLGACDVHPSAASKQATPAGAEDAHRVLYYRNPMNPADTSTVPKKDSMGMDYVPVYADEATVAGQIRLAPDRVQKLGVRTEQAARRELNRTLHLAGTIQADERRQWMVSPQLEGWIEELYVSSTGAAVRKGDPLAAVYAPEAVSARDELRIALDARVAVAGADADTRARADALVEGSQRRLRNWGVAEGDFKTGSGGRVLVVLRAVRNGIVIEKPARLGMRFMPGDTLFQLADLSRVWLVSPVFEQDLALVHLGTAARVTTTAYPARTFIGTVAFISPVLQAETRTVEIRIELANPQALLKPAMYAGVDLAAGRSGPVLAVPDSAVLDTGTRQLVVVDRGGGMFEPRTVRTGARGDGYTEVLSGLVPAEPVVVNGNFLIDAESNLKAVIQGMSNGASAEHRQ